MQNGVIVSWNNSSAYGFIRPDGGGLDVFVHLNQCEGACEDRGRDPIVGDCVSYEVAVDRRGRTHAANVTAA